MPADRYPVSIMDDGELVEVRAMLDEMGVPYAVEPEEPGPDSDNGVALLLSTPARALALRDAGADPAAEGCRLHVVVAAERSSGPIASDLPCDLILHQPVDPNVLRLLVLRAGYDGPDRRRARRVALSTPVRMRAGERDLDALLVSLSGRGCGLVLEVVPEQGQLVSIALAADAGQAPGVRLEGQVSGVRRRAESGENGPFDVSVVFGELDAAARKALRALMAQTPVDLDLPARCSGAGEVVPVTGHVAPRTPKRSADAVEGGRSERRHATRRRYRRRILGGLGGAAHALIGRDLSEGGMRVERDAALALGDVVKLAIYGDASSRPVMVKAVVERDDGLAGWFLRFEELTPAGSEALRRLLDSLPVLRAPSDAQPSTGVVVSELVERL